MDTPFNFSSYRTITKDTPFKILQLTDIHLYCFSDAVLDAFVIVDILITRTKPDLIVMTGDTVSGRRNGHFADIVVEFFDSFGIPYTFTLGNHDGGGNERNPGLVERFAVGAHSWFDRGPSSIHGYSNSAINLVNSAGKLVYSVVLLDSNQVRRYSPRLIWYDYIYPDQGTWYSWLIRGLSAYSGGPVKSLLFYHIPLPEIESVREDFTEKDPEGAAEAFREAPCCPWDNSGFWETVKEVGSTTHMFFGHDHVNLLNYNWEGVTWVYGLKTGRSYYHDEDRLGGTLITVGQDSSASVEFVYELGRRSPLELESWLSTRMSRLPRLAQAMNERNAKRPVVAAMKE
jgi:3',5'-cyclic AMP phosphodiesterase CpdA